MGTEKLRMFTNPDFTVVLRRNRSAQQLIYEVVEVIKEECDNGAFKLGCSIGGGIDQDEMMNPFNQGDSGIYVSKIRKHSAADRAGLEIGDKIISCNGHDMTRVSHRQAIDVISKPRETRVTLKVARNLVTEDPRLMMKRAAVEFRQSHLKTVS